MSRITESIRQINEKGSKAVIPYIPAGFPDMHTFWKLIGEMDEAGVAAIEIGIPFSDPVADGPVVEEAALKCLDNGVTLSRVLDELKQHRGEFKAPFVFMGYYNSFRHYGLERFGADAAQAGVSGLIIPDLPLEEALQPRRILNDAGLDLIPLIGVNTFSERLEEYARFEQGFIYFVSVLGTTGVRDTYAGDLGESLKRARTYFKLPLALGFGIKKPSQIEQFGDCIDAGIIGSAMIQHIENRGEVRSFFKS